METFIHLVNNSLLVIPGIYVVPSIADGHVHSILENPLYIVYY